MLAMHTPPAKLSSLEYRVGMVLAEHAGNDGLRAWVSVGRIADEAQARSKSNRAIWYALSRLVNLRLFLEERRGGHGPKDTTVYRMNARCVVSEREVSGKTVTFRKVVWNDDAGIPLPALTNSLDDAQDCTACHGKSAQRRGRRLHHSAGEPVQTEEPSNNKPICKTDEFGACNSPRGVERTGLDDVKSSSPTTTVQNDDDPWGIEAWIRRLDPTPQNDPDKPELQLFYGYDIARTAKLIGQAARLPVRWSGKWDALAQWLIAGYEPIALEFCIKQITDTVRYDRTAVYSMQYFDKIINEKCQRSSWYKPRHWTTEELREHRQSWEAEKARQDVEAAKQKAKCEAERQVALERAALWQPQQGDRIRHAEHGDGTLRRRMLLDVYLVHFDNGVEDTLQAKDLVFVDRPAPEPEPTEHEIRAYVQRMNATLLCPSVQTPA